MTDRQTLDRIGRFLRATAILTYVATVAELQTVQHYEELLQMIPLALCGLG